MDKDDPELQEDSFRKLFVAASWEAQKEVIRILEKGAKEQSSYDYRRRNELP